MADSTTITTKVETKEDSFIWKIENFNESAVQQIVQLQNIEYDAWRKNRKLASKWNISLEIRQLQSLLPHPRNTIMSAYLIFHVQPLKLPELKNVDQVQMEWICTLKATREDEADEIHKSGNNNIFQKQSFGFINLREVAKCIDETGGLVMNWTVKLRKLSVRVKEPSVSSLEAFQSAAKRKVEQDLLQCVDQADPTVIKIVGKNGAEYPVSKCVLAARSPVFKKLFQKSQKQKKKTTVINIEEINSKTLKVLLHFITWGELLPEWNKNDVIVELTYAASKYKLADLLEFLDKNLGNSCNSDSAGELLCTAWKFSLDTAKIQLLTFIQEKASSLEDFEKILKSIKNGGEAEKNLDKKKLTSLAEVIILFALVAFAISFVLSLG